jgi:hypothetical protein
VVVTERQYQQLPQATAADARLHRMSCGLQALDAGWVSVLSEQRKVRKLLLQVEEEAQESLCLCGAQSHAAVVSYGHMVRPLCWWPWM